MFSEFYCLSALKHKPEKLVFRGKKNKIIYIYI